MKELLVSIIIPTYNRSELIKESIKSSIEQTYRPIECIIVDDGSTDNTNQVVADFQKRNDDLFMLKYIFQANSGSQVARNTGTAAATGEFIQYLDSDDLLYPDKISSQVDYFIKHPECDAVFGDWETGTIDKKEKVIAYKTDDLIGQFLTYKCIHTLSMLMKKTLVQKIGDWDPTITRNQEIDFHVRGVLAGGNFEYLPHNCGLWRMHGKDQIINRTGIKDILNSYQKWETLLNENKIFDKQIRKKIANFYMWFLTQYEHAPRKEQLMLVKEIIRLDPEIPFYNNKKLVMLRKIAGKNIALKIWLRQYYKIGEGGQAVLK